MCEISSQYHKECLSYEQIMLPAKFGVTHCTKRRHVEIYITFEDKKVRFTRF